MINFPNNGFLIPEEVFKLAWVTEQKHDIRILWVCYVTQAIFKYDLSCFGFVAQRTTTTGGKFSRQWFSDSRSSI